MLDLTDPILEKARWMYRRGKIKQQARKRIHQAILSLTEMEAMMLFEAASYGHATEMGRYGHDGLVHCPCPLARLLHRIETGDTH